MKGCSDRVMQALWGSQGGPIKVAVYVALVDLLCLLNLGLNTPLFRQPTSADTLAIVFLAIFVSSSILLLAKVLRPKLWTIPGLWAVIFAAALVSHQELNIYLTYDNSKGISSYPKNFCDPKSWFMFYTRSAQVLLVVSGFEVAQLLFSTQQARMCLIMIPLLVSARRASDQGEIDHLPITDAVQTLIVTFCLGLVVGEKPTSSSFNLGTGAQTPVLGFSSRKYFSKINPDAKLDSVRNPKNRPISIIDLKSDLLLHGSGGTAGKNDLQNMFSVKQQLPEHKIRVNRGLDKIDPLLEVKDISLHSDVSFDLASFRKSVQPGFGFLVRIVPFGKEAPRGYSLIDPEHSEKVTVFGRTLCKLITEGVPLRIGEHVDFSSKQAFPLGTDDKEELISRSKEQQLNFSSLAEEVFSRAERKELKTLSENASKSIMDRNKLGPKFGFVAYEVGKLRLKTTHVTLNDLIAEIQKELERDDPPFLGYYQNHTTSFYKDTTSIPFREVGLGKARTGVTSKHYSQTLQVSHSMAPFSYQPSLGDHANSSHDIADESKLNTIGLKIPERYDTLKKSQSNITAEFATVINVVEIVTKVEINFDQEVAQNIDTERSKSSPSVTKPAPGDICPRCKGKETLPRLSGTWICEAVVHIERKSKQSPLKKPVADSENLPAPKVLLKSRP